MKTFPKSFLITLLTVVLIISSAVTCFATEQKGEINVTLKDKENNYINGVKVCACQIARLNNSGYFPTRAFENSGISIAGIINTPSQSVAKTIAEYININKVDVIFAISENGNVCFDELDLGIWLVFPNEDSKYVFNPYIVFVPFEADGDLYYKATSAPKLEQNIPNQSSVYVIKKWDDKNNASKTRPDSVTVELLNGGEVVNSVVLSEQNGWAHTFFDLTKDGDYSIREKEVAGYKVEYSGDAINGFVVTNTYAGEKLPQTGQYWWPIVIIGIAGVCFVIFGIYEIGATKNGKKR